jgi:hypothetical protein
MVDAVVREWQRVLRDDLDVEGMELDGMMNHPKARLSAQAVVVGAEDVPAIGHG